MKETAISREDLFNLPEYSCSLPTGTIIGKQWRCNIHAYLIKPIPIELHEWQIGEYIEHPDPDKVSINWTWAVDTNHEPHRGQNQ